MKNAIFLMIFLLLLSDDAFSAKDEFNKIKCGSDISKALIGQFSSNDRVVVIEGRHKDIGLKDLGAREITERLQSISWLICGSEYKLIVDDRSVVRDVIQIPPHSKDFPEFNGICQMSNKTIPEEIVAVLENKAGMKMLSAKEAWKIDEKKVRFVKVSTEGLLCPKDGIVTRDGGL